MTNTGSASAADDGSSTVDETITVKSQILERTSLRAEATRAIRAQIVAGTLTPGQLYAIGDVAARLGVSPTPVREALLDLAHEGLIEIIRNRGFRVRIVTDEELDHIYEVRQMLEIPAIERLAGRIPPPVLGSLRSLSERVDAAAERGDITTFLSLDRELHLALLGLLDNPQIVAIVGRLRDQARLYGLSRLAGSADLLQTAREHDALLDAIEGGDAATAARLMARHLDHTRGIWAGRNESEGAAM